MLRTSFLALNFSALDVMTVATLGVSIISVTGVESWIVPVLRSAARPFAIDCVPITLSY
jgi:hypothetical protein